MLVPKGSSAEAVTGTSSHYPSRRGTGERLFRPSRMPIADMLRKRRTRTIVFTLFGSLMTACAIASPNAPPPVVRFYIPPPIIVPGRMTGRFETSGGCIFFDLQRNRPFRFATVFPPGSKLSGDRRSVMLPNGQSIPFHKTVTIVSERPSNPVGDDQTCGPNPIEVIKLIVTE